ncbi:uncharacterized protein LOC109725281 [Ananas comosus]|uniref:Uncharacterized protein LOC109725281 n=1 Tax=Ananas comosus TaxID=4615 RepID=A0A6P5GVY2_ANACO|nr:uncharacterized protein LOC109725281 [Ananas comosus]
MAGTIVLIVVVVVVVTPTPLRAAPSHPAFADDPAPLRREEYGGGRIVDISHAYRPDMPEWESARGIGRFLWLRRAMANGSLANFSELKLPTHTGTHVDAPGHFYHHYFLAGFDVDTLDLAVLNGTLLHSFLNAGISYPMTHV